MNFVVIFFVCYGIFHMKKLAAHEKLPVDLQHTTHDHFWKEIDNLQNALASRKGGTPGMKPQEAALIPKPMSRTDSQIQMKQIKLKIDSEK